LAQLSTTGLTREQAPHDSTDMAPPALEARSLYRFFRSGDEETLALQGVSLRLKAGEFVAIVGPSGSGKSTLLSCLAGIDEPDGGTVRVGGQRLSHQPERARARMRAQQIGLLFQNSNLIHHLSVAQNVSLARRLANRANRARTGESLDSLGIGSRAAAYPSQLSGGELVRAGLAVALANDPTVLLADEPTGELDLGTEHAVLDLLAAHARRSAAILVASHSPAVAAAADRVITVLNGRISA
jgi:putative ABC transport system ATP-binding protein